MRMILNLAIVSTLLVLAGGCCPAVGQEAADIEAYPIDFCVVSGQKLGSMGTPVDYMHEGRLVRFCCQGCVPTFQADPEKYLSVLDGHQADANPAEAPAKPAPVRGCRPGCRH